MNVGAPPSKEMPAKETPATGAEGEPERLKKVDSAGAAKPLAGGAPPAPVASDAFGMKKRRPAAAS